MRAANLTHKTILLLNWDCPTVGFIRLRICHLTHVPEPQDGLD